MSFVHYITIGHLDRHVTEPNRELVVAKALDDEEICAIARKVEDDTGNRVDLGPFRTPAGALLISYTAPQPFPRFAWYVARAAHDLFGTLTSEKGRVYSPESVRTNADAPAISARFGAMADPVERARAVIDALQVEGIGWLAAEELFDYDAPAVVDVLIDAVDRDTGPARKVATSALKKTRCSREAVIAALERALEVDDPFVPRNAIDGLARLGAPSVERGLLSKDHVTRQRTLDAVARSRTIDPVPILLRALDAADPSVRENAIFFLGWLGPRAAAALPVLEARLAAAAGDAASALVSAIAKIEKSRA